MRLDKMALLRYKTLHYGTNVLPPLRLQSTLPSVRAFNIHHKIIINVWGRGEIIKKFLMIHYCNIAPSRSTPFRFPFPSRLCEQCSGFPTRSILIIARRNDMKRNVKFLIFFPILYFILSRYSSSTEEKRI